MSHDLKIKTHPLGRIQANCYIVSNANHTVVIDPGDEAEYVLSLIDGLTVDAVVATHYHNDHVGAIKAVIAATGAPFLIGKTDARYLDSPAHVGYTPGPGDEKYKGLVPDRVLSEGDVVEVGETTLEVIDLPGHTPGGIGLLSANKKVLFSGDTLFAGSIGRTDFTGGNTESIMKSIEKLVKLPDTTAVYSGHGPVTTIGREKKSNPFVLHVLHNRR